MMESYSQIYFQKILCTVKLVKNKNTSLGMMTSNTQKSMQKHYDWHGWIMSSGSTSLINQVILGF